MKPTSHILIKEGPYKYWNKPKYVNDDISNRFGQQQQSTRTPVAEKGWSSFPQWLAPVSRILVSCKFTHTHACVGRAELYRHDNNDWWLVLGQ